jgi:hypothetical protein
LSAGKNRRKRAGVFTKRVVAESRKPVEKLTKPASVFYIMAKIIYKTSERIYHNVGNGILKLFSFGSFPKIKYFSLLQNE